MNKLLKWGTLGLIIGLVTYEPAKKLAKQILIDVFSVKQVLLNQLEPVVFIFYIVAVVAIICGLYLYMNRKNLDTPLKILNEVEMDTYSQEDYRVVYTYYKKVISRDREHAPKNYQDISKRYQKSVYAITGGWRAGKTTAAGMLVDIIRKDKESEVLSETYHDTFNFGNLDESIISFFRTISEKTGIDEFKNLGLVSSPALDMSLNLGFVSAKRIIQRPVSPNQTRKNIFEKLNQKQGVHLIIIDDIDRLLDIEQVQWLRVIELLGKFQGKLLILVPVNINEVIKGLNELGMSPNYLDKILPKKLPVGMNIDYISRAFGINAKSSKRTKRLYSKYLLSLAIREVISIIASNSKPRKSEWIHEILGDRGSGIIRGLFNGLPKSSDNLSIDGHPLDGSETLIFRGTNQNYEDMELTRLIRYAFILNRGNASSSLDVSDINILRQSYNLNVYFDDLEYIVGSKFNHGDTSDREGWRDYWLDIFWPVAKEIKYDQMLSSFFVYDDIEREIKKVLKTKNKDDELKTFIDLVLSHKY